MRTGSSAASGIRALPARDRPRRRVSVLAVIVGAVAALSTLGVVMGGESLTGIPDATSAAVVGTDPGVHPGLAAPLPEPPGTTERVSVRSNEAQGNADSGGVNALLPSAKGNQAISANRRWVAFVSAAGNLTAGGANPAGGVFLRDRQRGTTRAIPWLDGGPFPATVTAAEPSISGDGSVIAFTVIVGATSFPGALVGTTTAPYVLVWDRQSGQTTIASLDSQGQPAPARQPSVSADGRLIAYTTWSAAPTPTPTAPPTPVPTPSDTTAPNMFNLTASGPDCFGALQIGTGDSATISVSASDPDDGVAGVILYYTPSGGFTYQYGMFFNTSTGKWQGTITGQAGWNEGQVVYYVRGYDSHSNYSAPLYPASQYSLTYSNFCVG